MRSPLLAWRKIFSLALCSSGLALSALPPIQTPPQTPIASCQPPSGANCNSTYWISTCGAVFGATPQSPDATNPCLTGSPNLKDAWRQQWLLNHPQGLSTDKIFKASDDDFVAAVPPDIGLPDAGFTGTLTQWASHEEKARVEARQLVNVLPKIYMRSEGQAGGAMTNCEQYVYRSFYDVERWVDGVNACKDDARCKVSLSLSNLADPAAPGIARRTLEDSEDAVIYGPGVSRISTMFSEGKISQMEADPYSDAYRLGSVPKNSFYAGTSQIFSPRLVAAFTDAGMGVQLSDLVDETARGETLYAIGFQAKGNGAWSQDSVGIHQNFVDEWEFHDVMNQRTSSTTDGEMREYRARNAAIIEAFDQGTDQMKCLFAAKYVVGGCNGKQINALGKANPSDKLLWENDPFAARSILASVSPYSFTWPVSLEGQVGFGTELQQSMVSMSDISSGQVSSGWQQLGQVTHLPGMTQGLLSPRKIPAPPGANSAVLLTVPPMMGGDLSLATPHVDPAAHMEMGTLKWMIDQTWKVNPPRIDLTSSTPRLDCRLPLPRGTVLRGAPLPLTIDEDLHTDTVWPQVCAMTNVLLTEWGRKLNHKPSCLDRNSYKCDWNPQDFVDRFVTKNIGYGAAAKEVEYQYCKRWTAGGQVDDPKHGVAYGNRIYLEDFRKVLADREVAFGLKLATIPMKGTDSFGTQKTDSAHLGDKVFGGGYSYDLSWSATPFRDPTTKEICRLGGSANASFTAQATLFTKSFKIVDALANLQVNEGDNNLAQAQAHLIVVGYEVFNTGKDPIDLTGSYAPELPGNKDQIQLLKVPFQVGPVTVTITAGISFAYGSTLTLVSQLAAPGSCTPTDYSFQMKSVFTPYADLGVWADADASLAGIVGVGLEVELTLVGLSLPLEAEVHLGLDPANSSALSLIFNSRLDLELTTMAGQINFYIEAIFMKVASFKIVSWPGFHQKFPIFRTPTVALSLSELSVPIQAPSN